MRRLKRPPKAGSRQVKCPKTQSFRAIRPAHACISHNHPMGCMVQNNGIALDDSETDELAAYARVRLLCRAAVTWDPLVQRPSLKITSDGLGIQYDWPENRTGHGRLCAYASRPLQIFSPNEEDDFRYFEIEIISSGSQK